MIGRAGALLALTLSLIVLSLVLGVRSIEPGVIWSVFTDFDPNNPDHIVVFELRLPRAIAAVLCGAALGCAGALMQTMTRNPLADPGVLGINGGAAFGVVLGIWVLGLSAPGSLVIPALAGAGVSAILVLLLGSSPRGFGGRVSGPDPVRLVLAGAALSALFLSLTWAILMLSRQSMEVFRYWVLGGFNQVDVAALFALSPLFIAGFVSAAAASLLINPLVLGDDTARALGARVSLARAVSLLAVVLLCGTTVSLAGPIAFVGLLVPHLVRPFTRADVRLLTIGAGLTGAALALFADVLGRLILPGQDIEAGAMMALIGGPALIILVQRQQGVRA